MAARLYTQTFDVGARCDRGRRHNNEDKILSVEQWRAVGQAQRRTLGRLYIVADGVGGNDNGELASARVVQQLMHHFYQDRHPPGLDPAERLRRAVIATSRDIFAEATRRNSSMRSTVVAALVLDPEGRRERRQLVVANVGDSPALLFRRDEAPRKITQDHLRQPHLLAQAMGDEAVEVALFSDVLLPDDIVVLCSDGLSDGFHGPLSPPLIAQVVHSRGAQAASEELVRLAKQAGSSDNISALVVRNGPRPFPVLLLAQLVGIGLALALLLAGAITLGLIPAAALPFEPASGAESEFLPGDPSAPSGLPRVTSTLAPTATPSPPPTLAPTRPPSPPRSSPAPARPVQSTSPTIAVDPTTTTGAATTQAQHTADAARQTSVVLEPPSPTFEAASPTAEPTEIPVPPPESTVAPTPPADAWGVATPTAEGEVRDGDAVGGSGDGQSSPAP